MTENPNLTQRITDILSTAANGTLDHYGRVYDVGGSDEGPGWFALEACPKEGGPPRWFKVVVTEVNP